MKNLLLSFFCCLMLLLTACQSEEPNTTQESTKTPETASPKELVQEPVVLKVIIDQLRMRAEAGEKGEEVLRLPEGSLLKELGEVSDFTTQVKLRGVPFDEPWLKVRTAEGQEGWVYAGGVGVASGTQQAYSQRLLQRRLQSFFGTTIAEQIQTYSKRYHAMTSSQDFADAYRLGLELRDTIAVLMETKIYAIDPGNAPDLEWLEQAMPGFNSQLVAEGTQAYLFANFKEWHKKAQDTQGEEDNRFTQICFQVHGVDSIEYFYPSWFMQTWDYGGHSLLGQGIHLKIMDALDAELKNSRLFEKEYQEIRDQLIDDMTVEHVTYWESQQKILEELNAILAKEYAFLSKEDKIELNNRKKMFEKAKANKIELNQRSGM